MILGQQRPSRSFAQTDASPFEAAAPARPRVHVLIVDDHDINRMICAAYCDIFDFTSASACDGEEAVEAVEREDFDIVLMDIHMPGMDGLEATRQIRAMNGPVSRTPIIAVTTDVEDSTRYLAAGMTSVVAKPVTAARLYAAIEAVMPIPPADSRVWADAEAPRTGA
jgi:two-component system, sensor histidine kinase